MKRLIILKKLKRQSRLKIKAESRKHQAPYAPNTGLFWRGPAAALLSVFLFTVPYHAAYAQSTYYHGDRAQKRIAVTMDDLYGLDHLAETLDLCAELGVQMTFFPIGTIIKEKDGELWRRVVEEGHEIGSHTNNHRSLKGASYYQISKQMHTIQSRLNRALGFDYPLTLLRPPAGQYDRNTIKHLRRLGFTKIILWDVVETDAEKAFKKTQNGSILLFHANKKDVRCLKTLLPMLLEAGYELTTVSELLWPDEEASIAAETVSPTQIP